MKIAFLTSCIEPGKDGVGDYTALLAEECGRRGHATRLVALNDPYAGLQQAGGDRLALSSSLPWLERVEKAKEFLSAFEPDFVSLQFVCYGFHPKGIDFALASRLHEIIDSRPVQIMFHELWIGAGKGASLKDRFFGSLQRSCILGMLGKLNVCVVHTSNAPYVSMLRDRNVTASLLPLFGAIPFLPATSLPRKEEGTLVLGLFGSLHPVWPPEPLFSLLLKTGKKIVIAHIGRLGAGGALWEKLERDYAGVIEFKKLGEQSVERAGEFFSSEIDFGIATSPWELIGKSATVTAMLEHGVPVIVNRDDWLLRGDVQTAPVSPLLIRMDGTLPEKLSTMQRMEPHSRLPETALQFLNDTTRTA